MSHNVNARKQANNADETNVKCVVSALHDHNAGHIATDEPEIRFVNRIDFSMKGGVAFSSEDAFVDKTDQANGKQHLQLSELQYCNVLMRVRGYMFGLSEESESCDQRQGSVRVL